MLRRAFAIAGAVVLAAAASPAFAQSGPLRLGFLTVRTGPLAAGGRQMEEGIQLLLKERSNTLAGRKVELFIVDTGGNPAGAKTKTQELVEHDKVDVIIGPLATFEALAIDDYIRESRVPLITPTSAAQNDLAQQKKNDYVLHAVGTAAQPMHALGEYAARKLGYKRVATIADDFTYGHEGEAGFQHAYEDNGGKVVQKLWSPLNAVEYGNYIAQIKPDVDAVYAGFAGINGLRFLKQFNEYGLKAKIAVLGNPTCVDEGVLKNMGEEALGVYSASWYASTIDSPDNKRFVQAVLDEYKVVPGFYTAGTYTAGLFLEDALKAIEGKFEDKAAFVRALHNVRLNRGPIGPIRMDEYGKPILNIYIRKVERKNGVLVNTVVDTVPDVGQFWKYDPKQFLASPPYSRDYPPARNLE
ncbi:MAG TPA: ABC transporter substrate-binding protein [Casimicrobiaceae bacterium]|jgi:branched-chain amino acid transport system substrate-binding protein|nr:ABC transporter substrate-binding protein [Casimicrobiaceae bacterium]